ncbi:MAG: SsrA-binding protein [Flavobacteriaceae bacterium]|nr:SsrA-binding protein [Flavobacteriaceae bacterium]
MMKSIYQLLAKLNKVILPSYSKKGLNLSKANKIQLLIIGYRYLVTKNSL